MSRDDDAGDNDPSRPWSVTPERRGGKAYPHGNEGHFAADGKPPLDFLD